MGQFGKKKPAFAQSTRVASHRAHGNGGSQLSAEAESFVSQLRSEAPDSYAERGVRRDFNPSSSQLRSVAGEAEYAGPLLRAGAHLIDMLILTVPFLALFGAAMLEKLGSNPSMVAQGYGALLILDYLCLYFVCTAVYYIVQEASRHQATIGKRIFGLIVTDKLGDKPGLGKLILRSTLGRLLANGTPFYIGFLMVSWTERKQALHDLMGGITVRKKNSVAQSYDAVFA